MAIQQLINDAIGPDGRPVAEVILPAGTTKVRDTINVTNVYGLVIRGAAGPVGTELLWVGDDQRPMWTLNRTQWVRLENFSIRAKEDNRLLEGVRIQQGPDSRDPNHWAGLDSSHCALDRVVFRGGGHLGTCVRVYRHPDDNAKNDYHRFSNVQCTGFTYAGFVLEGRNAKAVVLDGCLIQGDMVGRYGIDTVRDGAPPMAPSPLPGPRRGTFNDGAQVFCYGVSVVGVTESAVRIGDRNGNFLLDGGYSEKCARLLRVPEYGAGSGGPCAIAIRNFRFALGNIANDRIIVDCRGGSLSIVDCTIGHLEASPPVKIHVQTNGSFRFEGNFVASVEFTGRAPDGAPGEWGKKNRVYRNGGMEPLIP
jgi:hypothetical protein